MLQRIFLLLTFSLSLVAGATAQQFALSGKLTNKRQEALPFASVSIKELAMGTTTDEQGNYSFRLEPGKYDIVISMVGFKPQIITITMNADYKLNVLMEEDYSQTLSEVKIYALKRDMSEEIVKNVIKNKDKYIDDGQNYTTDIYIRATAEKDPLSKKPVDSIIKQPDLKNMSMAEVLLKADKAYPDKTKEVRTGVKLRGNPESLFYLTTTDGDFNFYRNLVQLPALSAMPMLSPISNSGLIAYKYKTVSIRKENGRTYYTIRVTPGKLGNALVTGEMEIMDSAWVMTSSHFELPKFHLNEYDYFSVDQQYEYVNNKAWMPVRQDFKYVSKEGKGKLTGRTIAIYSNYVVDTTFSKKNFGLEVSTTKLEAYERDSVFWEIVRKEPLTDEEIKFVHFRDSLSKVQTSEAYLDSADKADNKITFSRLLISGVENHNWRKERVVFFDALSGLYRPFQFGGSRIGYNFFLRKKYPDKTSITVHPNISIGLRNKDVQGYIHFARYYNPFKAGNYYLDIGREFAQLFDGDAWINHLKRSNVYVRDRIEGGHYIELVNGLYLNTEMSYTTRRSAAGYKTNAKLDTLLGQSDNQPIQFDTYSGLYSKIEVLFTPRQKYIREPREKLNLGSSYPTFIFTWKKAIPGIFKTKADFDYIQFQIKQKVKLGLFGDLNYSLITGNFVTRKDLRVVDYKYMKSGDPIHFMDPNQTFQSIDTTFAVFKPFYEGHIMQQLYGALLNKIPLLKKLQLREIVGGGVLFAPERNLKYAEMYAGVEKVFRLWRERYKIGGFVVSSIANTFNNPIQLRMEIQRYNRRENKWDW